MAHTYTEESAIPSVPTDSAAYYPDTDGKLMAASDLHRRLFMWTLQALEAYYAEMPDVYVSGDILIYYKEGDPKKSIVPDVLVSFGINKGLRDTYKTWVEGKAPDFVMAFASEKTYKDDLGREKDIYASMEIQDYFLYDAEGLYLPTPLMGFTLVDGVYEAITPDVDEGIHSSVLELDFRLQDKEIRIFDPIANDWVRTLAEQAEARIEQAKARTEKARAEIAKARAEKAEAEIALLREEIERLKGSSQIP